MNWDFDGQTLSVIQDALATSWNKYDADTVYNLRVATMDRDLLEQLVMANVGRRAAELDEA